ncbi:hypothetical protein ACHAWU_001211 [Discostella pseudostelligera]|uniref:DUF659 domain-containing protein n=1 Tax=Discostella pseudostelligera TaxID=259834 RepID=A0ABD3MZ08_9STRA
MDEDSAAMTSPMPPLMSVVDLATPASSQSSITAISGIAAVRPTATAVSASTESMFYSSIWECDMIEKEVSLDGKSGWKYSMDDIMEKQESAAQQLLTKKHGGRVSISSATSISKSGLSRQPSIAAALENASDIREANNAVLQMAIADLFHCENIPDSVVNSKRFRLVIQLARTVGKGFTYPNRQAIGKDLLDLNYKNVYESNVEALKKNAHIFGLAFLGDGATIKKMPLINVLAMCGSSAPPTTLLIKDCTDHMASGGKKDAPYIADLFEAKVNELDPTKRLTDIFLFDGASNVQKAGRLLAIKFPHAYCFHGGEHVVSLFFASIAKLTPIKALILKTCRLYNVFGSGAQHAVYAQFMAKSAVSNNGRQVGLIRGAGTRMALWFYAMMRLLRLKQPLKATIHQQQFLDLKLNSTTKAAVMDVQDDKFWKSIYILLRAVFPALKALRYCDSSQPMMDKLYFLSRRTTQALKNSQVSFNDTDLFGTTVIDGNLAREGEIVFGEEMEDEEDEVVQETPVAVVQEQLVPDDEDEEDEEESENPLLGVSSDDEEGHIEEIVDENSLGYKVRSHWEKRKVKLEHDYAITGWALCVMDEVRRDVDANLNGEHRNAIERVVERLHIPPCANPNEQVCTMSIGDVVNTFWKEYKQFQNRDGIFSKRGRWACRDVVEGRSHIWHENYSLPHTQVLGFVACRVTSKLCGIGAAERSWGGVKTIKDGNRSHIGSISLEKRAILYTTARIQDARAERERLEKSDAGKNGMFCDDDLIFNMDLEKFGVNVSELQGKPVERIFRAWVEDSEEGMRYKNDIVVKSILLEKYKNLVFTDTDSGSSTYGRTFTVSPTEMEFRRGRKKGLSGWMVIGESADDEVEDEPFSLEDACRYIASIPQEDGVQVIRRGEDDGGNVIGV